MWTEAVLKEKNGFTQDSSKILCFLLQNKIHLTKLPYTCTCMKKDLRIKFITYDNLKILEYAFYYFFCCRVWTLSRRKILFLGFARGSTKKQTNKKQQEMCQYDTDAPPRAILTHTQAFCKKWSWKKAITIIIIGRFYPKSNLSYSLWLYTCV